MIAITSGAPIALVDDDDVDRMIIRRVMERSGADNPVVEFSTAASFIEYLDQHSTGGGTDLSIALMDINMPGMTGLEALTQIRARPAYATSLQIVMLSTSDAEHDRQRSIDLGADAYLTKHSGVINYLEAFARTFTISGQVESAEG